VLQWFYEVSGCYTLPSDVMARQGAFERVREVASSTPTYSSLGPNRAELEAVLA
jgi:hypothetical protein